MDKELLTQTWKDPDFRTRPSAPRRATLPEHLSARAITELDDAALGAVVGGRQHTLADISNGFRTGR